MFDILLAAAAAQSEFRARQSKGSLPDFSRSDGIRFVVGLIFLALVYAGLSLTAGSQRPVAEQVETPPVGAVKVLGHL